MTAGVGVERTAVLPDRRGWIDLAFSAAVLGIGLLGFRTSFGGAGYLVVGLVGVACGVVIGQITAATRQPAIVVAAASVAAYFIVGGAVIVPDEVLAGFIPSGRSLSLLANVAVNGWKELLTTLPPVGDSAQLYAVPFICGLVSAVLLVTAVHRSRRVWTLVAGASIPLIVGILFGTHRPAALVTQGVGFGVTMAGWLSFRLRGLRSSTTERTPRARVVGAVLMLGVAGVGAWGFGDHLPLAAARPRFVLRDRAVPPFDPHQYPSPLAAFRQYRTRDLSKKVVFRVRGLPVGGRIRLATMDAYDGLVWSVAGGDEAGAGGSGYFERVGQRIPTTASGRTARVDVEIGAYQGVWMPDVGSVTAARFGGSEADALARSFRYNRETDTAAVPDELTTGDRYQLDVVVPEVPGTKELMGRNGAEISLPQPENVPEVIKSKAADVIGAAGPTFDRAEKIHQAMIDKDRACYSDGAQGEARSLAGHGVGRLIDFASGAQFVGNGEQYAAAAALMARVTGVPARVVMGFRPSVAPRGWTEVKGADVAAWIEVDLLDVGWVPVDVTPDPTHGCKDTPPPTNPPSVGSNQAAQPPPVTLPPSDGSGSGSVRKCLKPGEKAPASSGGATTPPPRCPAPAPGPAWWLTAVKVGGVALSPFAVFGLFAGSIVALKVRRRTRRQQSGSPTDRISGGWAELTDLARDMGRPVPDLTTRREAASFLGGEAAAGLARRADASIWGAGTPDQAEIEAFWGDVDTSCDALLAPLSRAQRWRARLNPTSLRRTEGGRRSRGRSGAGGAADPAGPDEGADGDGGIPPDPDPGPRPFTSDDAPTQVVRSR